MLKLRKKEYCLLLIRQQTILSFSLSIFLYEIFYKVSYFVLRFLLIESTTTPAANTMIDR